MSMGGIMGAAASGLSAQASRLATVADNVANASTTGYKQAGTEFYSLVEQVALPSAYRAAGVSTSIRHNIVQQGAIEGTNSTTDLAVNGNGFFLVSDAAGSTSLTRSGSFVPDAQGHLVNGAGLYLNACPGGSTANAGAPEPVVIDFSKMYQQPTTQMSLAVNVPSSSSIVAAANLPSTNSATSAYSAKTSIVAYDDVGTPVTMDVYMTKSAANTWDLAVYNQTDATAGGFPYASSPVATQSMQFSATGDLVSGGTLAVPIPNGQTVNLDMSKTTQYSAPFGVVSSTADGFSPTSIDHLDVATDGTIYSVYQNGAREPSYRIPLASVASPDLMTPKAGTAFIPNSQSGSMLLDFPQQGGRGSVVASSLEQSTVDLATELTTMIETQRAYQANSKTFQAGAELLDVLVNLK